MITDITDYNVGEKVKITPDSLKIIENGNRSILAYPCDSYVDTARTLVGMVGEVTHRFRPGYEMTVGFQSATGGLVTYLHMKDNWVERA